MHMQVAVRGLRLPVSSPLNGCLSGIENFHGLVFS
jgi:hypothetical protein